MFRLPRLKDWPQVQPPQQQVQPPLVHVPPAKAVPSKEARYAKITRHYGTNSFSDTLKRRVYYIVPSLSSNGSSEISSHARARNSRRRSNNKDYLGGFRPLLQPFKLFYKIGKKMVILSYVAITDNHGYPLHILSSEQARLKLL